MDSVKNLLRENGSDGGNTQNTPCRRGIFGSWEEENAGKRMSENESDSSIPFIDDAEDQKLAGELAQKQYNLTITRNYQNKTRRVEISKILQDADPVEHRSLSPVAPLANDAERLTDEEEGETVTGAEFELTIKSNNSVIRIQGYDNKSTISFNSGKGGNVYDLISREVDKIFRKPEREEIERAMKNIKNGEKRTKQKKNWKILTKSLISGGKLLSEQRRKSEERYPKMVLLQDPKPKNEDSDYPKMVYLNDQEKCKTEGKKKKLPSQNTKKIKGVEDKEAMLVEDVDDKAEEMKEDSKTDREDQEKKKQGFCENCERSVKPSSKETPNFDSEEPFYPFPPQCCQYPSLYMPVYNRQLYHHPYTSGDFCCGGRVLKDTTTQTNPSDVEPAVPDEGKDMNDLPIEFLSSFFPRIVVMKSFQEEVPSEDPKIFELPKTDTETEDEKVCEELDEKQEEEPPIEEDVKDGQDENGFSEDSGREETGTNDDLPLTRIGHSIYDKLNELAIERKREEKEEQEQEREEKADEVGTKKSPRNVTLEFKNKLMRFTLAEDKVNLEVQEGGREENNEGNSIGDDKVIVRKSKLWYPSGGKETRKGLALSKDFDGMSLSISERENLVFTFEMGRDSPRKRTSEAKVGTDGLDLAGGDFAVGEGLDKRDLSPRTDEILKSLRTKLEATEGVKKRNRGNYDFKFPGLFLIRPFDCNRGFPRDEYFMSKEREARKRQELPGKLREYYCEDCLATMRLFEDGKVSVKSMIDKFETIIHLGSY